MLFTNEQIKSAINNIIVNNGLDTMEANGKPLGILDDTIDIERYGARIFSQPHIANPFMTALYQQFIYRATAQHYFSSPFNYFREKRDGVAYGTYEADVQPIFPVPYDMKAFDRILDFWETPAIVQYFAITRQDTFPQTITKTQLRQAFQSYEAFDDFLAKMILSARNGNVIIETNAIKMMLNQNIANGVVITREYPSSSSALNSEFKWQDFAAEIVGIANGMTAEPTTLYNNYANVEGSNGVEAWTQSDRRDLVLIGDATTIAKLKSHVLALAYNKDEVDFEFHFIILNDWNYKLYDSEKRAFTTEVDSPVKLLLCDGGFIKMEDNLDEDYSDPNIMTMGLQRALQVQQTLGLRVNRNAIAWVLPVSSAGEDIYPQFDIDKSIVNIGEASGTADVNITSNIDDVMNYFATAAVKSAYALTSGNDVDDAIELTAAQAATLVTATKVDATKKYTFTRTSTAGTTITGVEATDTIVVTYELKTVDGVDDEHLTTACSKLVTVITPATFPE